MDSWTWGVIVAIALIAAAVLGVAVWLLLRLVRTRRELRRAGLPTGPKWVFWGAVLYLVLPTDLVPDPVYLDDIGVLLLALKSMRTGRQDALATEPQNGTGTALRG
ncbi:YkvA family protein [Streptomyces sp. DSM 40750]|uniref:YkvA family protein n=1 Tax=Streptomyces sp. DSM 40750 TaxID=2801030 RepID=UPI00214B5624|nr:YkvA family protein [Streptomyces sp. DSM 40750]UUU26779.1 YkvA family protein [Streptomyces sp. DSM 40750]